MRINSLLAEDTTILSSSITGVASNTIGSFATNTTIACEKSATPAEITNYATALSQCNNPTTATVAWDLTAAWTAGETKTTPDLTAPIQEVVNLTGFNGWLQFIFRPGSTNNTKIMAAWDHLTYDPPTLTIEYTPPATVPAAINDLVATPSASQITLTWTEPDDGGAAITQYDLYVDGVLDSADVVSPLVITGLTNGTEYGLFTVVATNTEGNSDPSNEVSATPIDVPAAITDLAVIPDDMQITLTWTEPENRGAAITQYDLYINGVLDTLDVVSPLLITGLDNGVEYGLFTIISTNSVGESDPSNEVSATPASVPAVINDLVATVGNGEITFSWTPPYNGGSVITSYAIYLDSVLVDDDATNPYVVTGLTNDVISGLWTVTATNAVGESQSSNGVYGTPSNPEQSNPVVPSNIKIIRRYPVINGYVQIPPCLEQNRNAVSIEELINNGYKIDKFSVSGQESVQIEEINSTEWYPDDPI